MLLGIAVLVTSVPIASTAAQDSSSVSKESSATVDSVNAGRAAGTTASSRRSVGRYFAAGILSGLALGVAGPVTFCEATPDVPPATITAIGAAGLIGVSVSGARAGVNVPPADEAQLQQHGARYQQAFRDAYTTQVRRRRTRAALLGGATGAVVGYGALLFLLTHIRT